jgi:hypothetical protein
MQDTLRGVIGLGVTLFILAAGMATVNGIVLGLAAMRMAKNPNDVTGQALILLF